MSSAVAAQQAKTDAPQKSPQPATHSGSDLAGNLSNELVDMRPQALTQRRLQEAVDNSEHTKQLKAFNRLSQSSKAVMQLQSVSAMMNSSAQAAAKPNSTGLPDNLKSGIESLSGMGMDHVKVHYNSSQPAQLNAHAYAQGGEIHVAPGQEQHLPHEAWHVVQQAQGRVKPTLQMKPEVSINDDATLEGEADVMGAKALAAGSKGDQDELANATPAAAQGKDRIQSESTNKVLTAQLERKYDETLLPEKTKLLAWLIDGNNTLGISQEGTSENMTANKKSNFSWHHILAFADLVQHGESKTSPANHGGNVRLGPMKNRAESSDVSGGTAVDYSYLPLDESENIVLDAYSKSIFDGTITASDETSLTNKLTPSTHDKTPQTANFVEGEKASSFSEWFFELQMKNVLLSKEAISQKLPNTAVEKVDPFVKAINTQFESLLRTYKYYNKKKEVQITSGVPITDVTEGNFGHITIKKGVEQTVVKASTVIDELLRDQKWVKRGSQGAIQDETTTYKFGLSKHAPLTLLVEAAIANIDLTAYRDAKLTEFTTKLESAFKNFRSSGKGSEAFDQEKETGLIDALVENLRNAAVDYDSLWNGIGADAVEGQYVKVKLDVDGDDWPLPVPAPNVRRNAVTATQSMADPTVVSDAWAATFVEKLDTWDGETPLFDEEADPKELMYIDFSDVEDGIENNEHKWAIKDINSERQEKSNNALSKTFLTDKLTPDNVKISVAKQLSDNREKYLSDEKKELKLAEVKEELKNHVNANFNVFSRLLKGVAKDLQKRKTAFGADFEGFVNSTKWNVINSSTLPDDIEGLEGKKWADLGDIQGTFYAAWIEQEDIATLISTVATSESLQKTLP